MSRVGSGSHPQVPGSHTQSPQVCVEAYRLVHAAQGICTENSAIQVWLERLLAVLLLDEQLKFTVYMLWKWLPRLP